MFNEALLKLTKKLYPTGRAFKIPNNSFIEGIHKALIEVEGQAYSDSLAILNAILPDNSNFTAEDATDWETRLGLIVNTSLPLEDRKLAIKRKMNHPGTIPARQNWLYLQQQLQEAGFNVYVYENLTAVSPFNVLLTPGSGQMGPYQMGDIQLGDVYSFYPGSFTSVQFGMYQLGDVQLSNLFEYNKKVVNSLIETEDANFSVGINFRSTFFIGGNPLGSFADVDISRKKEFRQLILKIKPVQTVAYLFINYI